MVITIGPLQTDLFLHNNKQAMEWSCKRIKAICVCHFLQICCFLWVWNCSVVVTNASRNCSRLIKYCWTYIVLWWQHNVSWTVICGSMFMAPWSLTIITCLYLGVLWQIRQYLLGKSWHMRVEHIWWSDTPGWKTGSCHYHFYKYLSISGREDNGHYKCIVTYLSLNWEFLNMRDSWIISLK